MSDLAEHPNLSAMSSDDLRALSARADAVLARRQRVKDFMRDPSKIAKKRESIQRRREAEALEADGYRRHETDWEIIRGGRLNEVIVDARVSRCGKYVWTKLGVRA